MELKINGKTRQVVPVKEFTFQDYDGNTTRNLDPQPPAHPTLTCKNHLDGRWSSKNPFQRSIHFLGWEDETGNMKIHPEFGWRDCSCPFEDLLVIVDA